MQDDAILFIAHARLISQDGQLQNRIEAGRPIRDHYELKPTTFFVEAIWSELDSMYRVLKRTDEVWLVVCDLDDTLWNGVSGEQGSVGPEMVEAWPTGVAEALLYLKKRGVLLGIISKNDEERIRPRWDAIFQGLVRLEDFASVKINWRSKPENMQQMLAEVNLLPRSVVFVDDNPVERDAMRQAFPEIRVIGKYPYYIRRILLWSAELQVPYITSESTARTEMVQAQILREDSKKGKTREEFLASLDLSVTFFEVDSTDGKWPRCFELLNKTNQFNTTGKRWSLQEIEREMQTTLKMYAFETSDRFTRYGLVGVVLVRDNRIEQFAMSCRVVGMDIEVEVVARLARLFRSAGLETIRARLVETEFNTLCREFFRRCGFRNDHEDIWVAEAAPQSLEHVRFSIA